MNLAIGIIVAPRPVATYKETVESLTGTGVVPILFCEPGVSIKRTEYVVVDRPSVETERCLFTTSYPEGVFGNFQNWIQAGRDLLEITDDADTFLICEDDALFSFGIMPLLERDLWPSDACGCVSLYSPNMQQYKSGTGLFKTNIIHESGRFVARSNNLVGSLALLFPRQALQELVYHDSIAEWKGSHTQARSASTKPWERKAVDTWIGRTLVSMKKEVWHYSPSLVLHYSPLPDGVSNSSMGHDAPRGKTSTRQCREWAGRGNVDLLSLYPSQRK